MRSCTSMEHLIVNLDLSLWMDPIRTILQLHSVAGGTAFNGVVEELKKLTVRVAHVLPVSDDGGSTAEIVRVLGVLHQLCTFTLLYCHFWGTEVCSTKIMGWWYRCISFSCFLDYSSGGPAVGDIRSRCLRLSDPSTSEALAVRTLLGHRLPLEAQKAKFEW